MKTKFFDPETMQVGGVISEDGETWFHSDDGTVSREVGEGELLIPYSDYAAFIAEMQRALQQRRANILTASSQGCDSLVSMLGQRPDNEATKRDTSAARAARRKPPTAKQICRAHTEAVSILKDAKIIREVSGGTYRNFKDLPTNVPQYLVDYVNQKGCKRPDGRPYTQETLSPVVSAMKITARPSLFRVCYLIVLAVVVAVIVTKIWFWVAVPDGISTDTDTDTEQTKQIKFDFDFVKQVCEENNISLTDYRVGLIVKKEYPDKAALVAEIKNQHAEMLKAMKK